MKIHKIQSITLTIDDCDYCYNIKNNKLISYWCDCPVEFDVRLAESLTTYANFINKMIEDKQYTIEIKENK